MDNKNNFLQAAQELFGSKEKGTSSRVDDSTQPVAEGPAEGEPPRRQGALDNSLGSEGGSSVSILSKGLTITGQVTSNGHVEISGTLTGDLDAAGDVKVFGTVEGNVRGKSVLLSSAKVKGNIEAKERVTLDDKSTVVGDIASGSLMIAGRVKGNVKVDGTVAFEQTALLLGDVEYGALSVKEGAELCGKMVAQGGQRSKNFEED